MTEIPYDGPSAEEMAYKLKLSTRHVDRNAPYNPPLSDACRLGELEKVMQELKNGADVNEHDGPRTTPAQRACWSKAADSVKILQILIERGADLNVKNIAEKTALDYAYETKAKPGEFTESDALIKMLEENGAKLGKDVYCPIVDSDSDNPPPKPTAIAA